MGRGKAPRELLLGGTRMFTRPSLLSIEETEKIANELVEKGYLICRSCKSLSSNCRQPRVHRKHLINNIHPYVLKRAYGVKPLWKSEEPEESIRVPKGMLILDGKRYAEDPEKGLGTQRVERATPLNFFTFERTSVNLSGFPIPDDFQTKLVWKTGEYTKSITIIPELWNAFGTLDVLSKYFGVEENLDNTRIEFLQKL